jgi:hypothetical protein
MGRATVAKKIKTLSASATGAPVTAATTLMLNADAYRCGVTGAVLENIPLRGVVDRQSQTALCPSRRVSCALDGAISRARVQKIAAKGCTRMEVRVSYVEKRRILQRTATCARKMVSLISQPLAFSGNMSFCPFVRLMCNRQMGAPLPPSWALAAKLELTKTTFT